MKLPLKALVPLLAVAALAAACNPFTPWNWPTADPTPYPQDPRFAEFKYETDDKLEVQERVDSFNERIPKLGATDGHVLVAHFRDGASWQPTPDRQFWLTGVAEVPDTTITMLVDDSIGDSSLLPGIHPLLYTYLRNALSQPLTQPLQIRSSAPIQEPSIQNGDRSRSASLLSLPTAISLSSPAMASTPSTSTLKTRIQPIREDST